MMQHLLMVSDIIHAVYDGRINRRDSDIVSGFRLTGNGTSF